MHDPISPSDCAIGALSSLENARSLLAESKLLLDAGYAPRANLLALVGAEEVVKANLLGYAAVLPSSRKSQWSDFWWVFRNHDAKELFNYVLKFMRGGFPKAADFFSAIENTGTFLDVRNLSTYVDRFSPDWLTPTEVFPKGLAQKQVNELETRLAMFDSWTNENDVATAINSINPSIFQKRSMFTEARAVVRVLKARPRPDRREQFDTVKRFLGSLPTDAGGAGATRRQV